MTGARAVHGVSSAARFADLGLVTFDEIYEREFNYVWRNLGRLGVRPADLADAAHDVFVVLLRRWDQTDRDRPMRPWLFAVVRRVAAAVRRRGPVAEEVELEAARCGDHAERDPVWRALDVLDDDRRVIVILHDLEGHTGAEIAVMLKIPANTVHSRLRLARVELVAAVERLQRAR